MFAAVLLALGLVELDIIFADTLATKRWHPLLNAGAAGSRGMLTALAESLVIVAGLGFLVAIGTLSLASARYASCNPRQFMGDRVNQFILGVFAAVSIYCLLVLRTIRDGAGEEPPFVPLLAVGVAMLLALVSMGCVIFFIHHLSTSIQASSILQSITAQTIATIDHLYPITCDNDRTDRSVRESPLRPEWFPLAAWRDGYVHRIDIQGLVRFAQEQDTLVRIERPAGEFVLRGAPLMSLERQLPGAVLKEVRWLVVIRHFRTGDQDATFGIGEIVTITKKALSSGVNDTRTAISCLDNLSSILSILAERDLGTSCHSDLEGKLRVISRAPSFADYVAQSFDEVRRCATGHVPILIHMLCALQRVAQAPPAAVHREPLILHTRLVAGLADHSVRTRYDRKRVNEQLAVLRDLLGVEVVALPELGKRYESRSLIQPAGGNERPSGGRSEYNND